MLKSAIGKLRGSKQQLNTDTMGQTTSTLALERGVGSEDLTERLKASFLEELTTRPRKGMTEVRRDGKDDVAVAKIIKAEFERALGVFRKQRHFVDHMQAYASAAWATMESMHQLFLEDETPENERARLDPDHWYETNLTNASLFANLTLDKMEQVVPGRLFTTRMPRDLVEQPSERADWLEKCKKNDLRVICVLTESHEFKKYSGVDGLLDFYKNDCGLIVYNRAIPDFQIPTGGDLMNNILDLTYHLSQGRNCLVHCAGGTGRTGMVIAAVIKNLGCYDPIARIRRVKSTYVETYDQELFLKNMPKVIDSRIIKEKPNLARAIAAEHLIQVFHTHGKKLDKAEGRKDVVESIEEEDNSKLERDLKEAYRQTFDLVDLDKSGTLDRAELKAWFDLCGSELDLSQVMEAMLAEGNLTRERFATLMCTSAKDSRRDYDISGQTSGGHH